MSTCTSTSISAISDHRISAVGCSDYSTWRNVFGAKTITYTQLQLQELIGEGRSGANTWGGTKLYKMYFFTKCIIMIYTMYAHKIRPLWTAGLPPSFEQSQIHAL